VHALSQVFVIKGGMKRAGEMTVDRPITTAAMGNAVATFTLGRRPEYIRAGDTFLFRASKGAGFTGYGVVKTAETKVRPLKKTPRANSI
jgi:hypothetical protein